MKLKRFLAVLLVFSSLSIFSQIAFAQTPVETQKPTIEQSQAVNALSSTFAHYWWFGHPPGLGQAVQYGNTFYLGDDRTFGLEIYQDATYFIDRGKPIRTVLILHNKTNGQGHMIEANGYLFRDIYLTAGEYEVLVQNYADFEIDYRMFLNWK